MPVDPLRELEQGLRRDFTDLEPKVAVPDLPRDIRLWLKNVRPIVDGKQQDFRSGPMWLPIYDDNHPDIMIVSGRQLWKSTYCTNLLAYMATTRPQVEVGYVTKHRCLLLLIKDCDRENSAIMNCLHYFHHILSVQFKPYH